MLTLLHLLFQPPNGVPSPFAFHAVSALRSSIQDAEIRMGAGRPGDDDGRRKVSRLWRLSKHGDWTAYIVGFNPGSRKGDRTPVVFMLQLEKNHGVWKSGEGDPPVVRPSPAREFWTVERLESSKDQLLKALAPYKLYVVVTPQEIDVTPSQGRDAPSVVAYLSKDGFLSKVLFSLYCSGVDHVIPPLAGTLGIGVANRAHLAPRSATIARHLGAWGIGKPT